ncbi:RNA polymerase sigma factor [Ascidiimonas sp. W6]|uniref:RNA polymerase sigma factor n=1 Tax=Ascidiimonas meishanensis TaxID=3128903 RepID=UPI0030EEDCB0
MLQTELIEKCKINDRKAQLNLYKKYSEGMYFVAMRFLKNQEDAEDVMQEAFIKAFQRIHQYKAEVTFGAWLKRIVINKCIDHLKGKQIDTFSLEENFLQVTDKNEDWKISSEITIDEVKKAILTLSDKYRYVITLYLIEGYDHAEISDILKISEVTSRTQLLRGKQKLRELLNTRYHGTRS